MTKSAAFFFDPGSRQLAALYADSQLEKGRSPPRAAEALYSRSRAGLVQTGYLENTVKKVVYVD
jgi:hypothetical protein